MFLRLAFKSLAHRKESVLLTILAMSVSIFVLLGVEHIRTETKESFNSAASGVDLIVGARTSSLNLLLYSVFRLGSPAHNINWQTYQAIADNPEIAWAIPMSLGDSHKGYKVMGTTPDYFIHFSFGEKRRLTFSEGRPFSDLFDVVIGSEVARKLNYSVGDNIVLAHGLGKVSFTLHEDRPFNIVGILAATGTPVDQTVHVSLEAIEAIHTDSQQTVTTLGSQHSHDPLESSALQPKSITAIMLSLNSRIATFRVQRDINNYRKEPLSAILPGVALAELWQVMGILENTLLLVSGLVLIAALLGLSAMTLASVRERTQEVLLLRVIGASPAFLFLLIQIEALLMSLLSIVIGVSGLSIGLRLGSDFLSSRFALQVNHAVLSENNLLLLLLILGATIIAAAIPSFLAYKNAQVS